MALKSRLRRALTSGSQISSAPSSSSSSTSDLTTSPTTTTLSSTPTSPALSPSPTTTNLLKTTPTATAAATTTTTPLAKTPSRLRLLLGRSKTSPKSSKGLHPEWHDYTGPRSRCRKVVDPLHRAHLESWDFEDSYGRKTSVASSYYRGGVSPCQSRAGSLDLKRVEARELEVEGELNES